MMSSVRLSLELQERVRRVALLKGLTVSQVHRLALEEFCERQLDADRRSRYDDVIGVVPGPSDLATRASEHFADLLADRRG
jgi:hypothetical protein